jgi:hypothetical protein
MFYKNLLLEELLKVDDLVIKKAPPSKIALLFLNVE